MEGFEQLNCRWHLIEPYVEYAVTENGDVYSYRTSRCGFQGLRKMSLHGRNNENRYIHVVLSSNGVAKYLMVHRLVAKYFCDGYFEGAVVNHIDGDKHNNHYTNLEWITQAENIRRGYVSSGVDQTRNYYMYNLIDRNGNILQTFKGRNASKLYIEENNIDASFLSLIRYGVSRGYRLEKVC